MLISYVVIHLLLLSVPWELASRIQLSTDFVFIFGALQHSGMYGSTAASSQEQLRQEARLLVSKFAIANGYRCHSHCPIKIGSRT